MMGADWGVQAIGFAAALVTAAAPHMSTRTTILIGMAVGQALWGGHFFLLGAVAGGWVAVITGVRNLVFITWFGIAAALPFAGFALVMAVWRGGPGWEAAALAAVIGSFAAAAARVRTMRLLILLGSTIWFAHALAVGSAAGMIFEPIMFIGTLTAVIRDYWSSRRVLGGA